MSWYRLTNIETRKIANQPHLQRFLPSFLKEVSYFCTAPITPVSQMKVLYYGEQRFKIRLETTGSFDQELVASLKTFHVPYQDYLNSLYVLIECKTEIAFAQLLKAFHDFNSKQAYTYFTPELILELKNVVSYLSNNLSNNTSNNLNNNNNQFLHKLPLLKKPTNAYLNPESRRETKQLAKLFDDSSKEHDPLLKNIFNIYLIKGGNPDSSCGSQGQRLFYYIILMQNFEHFLKALLFYGADPFSRDTFLGLTPLEMARRHQPSIFDYIINYCVTVKRPVSTADKPASIIAANIIEDHKKVTTNLLFSNEQELQIQIKLTTEMNVTEKQALLKLYTKFFEIPGGTQEEIHQLFLEQINTTKLVEILIIDNNIVGFNLYELVISAQHKDHVFLHIIYSLIHPSFRGNGLMSLLVFEKLFVVQSLLVNFTVGTCASIIHPSSLAMFAPFLHFPKYRPDYLDSLARELLAVIFHGTEKGPEYKHEGMTCYIVDDVKVIGPTITDKSKLIQWFYMLLLDMEKNPNADTRGTFALFFAENESFKIINEIAFKLGINDLKKRISDLAKMSQPMFSELNPNIKFQFTSNSILSASDFLFWNNTKIDHTHLNDRKINPNRIAASL